MTGRLSAAGALGDGSLVVAGIGLASTSAGARQVPLLLILRASGQWEPVAEVGVPAEATPESLGSLELGSLVVAGDRIFVGGGDSEGAVIWTGAPET